MRSVSSILCMPTVWFLFIDFIVLHNFRGIFSVFLVAAPLVVIFVIPVSCEVKSEGTSCILDVSVDRRQ